MTKRRKYYSLLERQPGQLFTPEFGDYIKAVVVQERADMKHSGSFIKGTEFMIVETNGTQKQLTEKVDAINDEALRAKALKEQESLAAKAEPRNYGGRPLAKVSRAVIDRNNRLLDREHPGTMADRKK